MGKRGRQRRADRAEILARFIGGEHKYVLDREYGLANQTLYRWAKEEGIVIKRGTTLEKYRQERLDAMALLGEGKTLKEVGELMRRCMDWVANVRDKFLAMELQHRRGRRGGPLELVMIDQVGSGKVGRGRRITLIERVRISQELQRGTSTAKIAQLLGRDRSTIYREVKAHRVDGIYCPQAAETAAYHKRGRPKELKLDSNLPLRARVIELLDDDVSAQQISVRLKLENPDNKDMQISHEAIYQALYVQGAGALRQELRKEFALQSGRTSRIPRSRLAGLPGRGRKTWVDGALISDRPAEVEDRAIPGHFEGDLIIGKDCQSALVVLTERSTRYLSMRRLPGDHTSPTVIEALTQMARALPGELKTITWDQGSEMAHVKDFEVATGVKVYFANPHSPWERGSNERLNRDIRRYFPKGTDFAKVTDEQVQAIQDKLNRRPRVVLEGMTPTEKMQQQINDAMTA